MRFRVFLNFHLLENAFITVRCTSAKRGIAIASRLSVCPSVCPVTLVDHDHIG